MDGTRFGDWLGVQRGRVVVVHVHKSPQPRYDLIPLAETAVAAFLREPSGRRASFSNNQRRAPLSSPRICTCNAALRTLPLTSHHHTRLRCDTLRPKPSSHTSHPSQPCSEELLPLRRPRPASSSPPPPGPRSHRRCGEQLPPSPSTPGGATTRKISLSTRCPLHAPLPRVGEGYSRCAPRCSLAPPTTRHCPRYPPKPAS